MTLPINPYILIAAILAINVLTLLVYWYDKRASQRSGWRIPETTLHLLALIGGSPSAYYAQQKFRHKTKKQSFRMVFWVMVIIQLCFIAYILY